MDQWKVIVLLQPLDPSIICVLIIGFAHSAYEIGDVFVVQIRSHCLPSHEDLLLADIVSFLKETNPLNAVFVTGLGDDGVTDEVQSFRLDGTYAICASRC